jgi:hypothetical protein
MTAAVAADFARRVERKSIEHKLFAGDKAAYTGTIGPVRRLRINGTDPVIDRL